MAKRLGRDRRVWVKQAAGDTFVMIKGNTSISYARTYSPVTTTVKDDFPDETSLPGFRSTTVNMGFLPDLPDVNGYERLIALMNAAAPAPIEIQIRKGGSEGATPADVEYHAFLNPTSDSRDMNLSDAVTETFAFLQTGTATVDLLK